MIEWIYLQERKGRSLTSTPSLESVTQARSYMSLGTVIFSQSSSFHSCLRSVKKLSSNPIEI